MSKTVLCIAKTQVQAATIATKLEKAGVKLVDISILYPDRTGNRDFTHEHNTKAPEGATIGSSTGGVAGGVLGLLAGMGALAIPGVGPFIAAGPIMAALSGAAVGAAIGGIAGALVGMGIPEYEAKQYETKVKDGNILLSVHSHDRDEANLIKEIMKSAKADDISITTEESVSDSKKGKESVNHLDRRENYLDRRTGIDHGSNAMR